MNGESRKFNLPDCFVISTISKFVDQGMARPGWGMGLGSHGIFVPGLGTGMGTDSLGTLGTGKNIAGTVVGTHADPYVDQATTEIVLNHRSVKI